MQQRLLLMQDHDLTWQQVQKMLQEDAGIKVETAADAAEAHRALLEQSYSVFIMDWQHPDGLKLIEAIRDRNIPVTVIVLASRANIDDAVQAMRLGVFDFLPRPVDLRHLQSTVQQILRNRIVQDAVLYLHEELQKCYAFHNIISKNARMHAISRLITSVAQTATTVLIEGETGTGKEQIARAIHQTSRLRKGPLIAVNCAAVPETLLESELFGHEKGAFTGAVHQRRGRFELAHGGTLLLDEIGDVPPAMQAKLLRVLQERRFERVGGTQSIDIDVRVIAATNRSLQRLVHEGRFREDLFYRVNVVKIEVPPLRERPEDIPLLAAHFIQKYTQPGDLVKRLDPQCMDALTRYHWPGNVRELENAMERVCVTCANGMISREALPTEVLHPEAPRTPFTIDLNRSLPDLLADVGTELEKLYIRKALERSHGHVGRCADICGLSRRSMSAKIAAYGIEKKTFKGMWRRPSSPLAYSEGH